MLFTKTACAAALSSVLYAQKSAAAAAASSLALDAKAVQIGSTVDGNAQIGADVNVQAKSLTSNNNFINNCVGKTLTNGLQITAGSCNGITMGDIPSKDNMMSTIITFPPQSAQAVVQANVDFDIKVQMIGIVAGSFTNADATYYAAPQFLQGGKVVGHTHITVQDMGSSLNPTQALDPTQFAFFKGINDAGDGNGGLTATVTGGLPAGNYRVCTLGSASNHQPALMPVAQRGTVDDCTKFIVGGNGNTPNNAANDAPGGLAAAALAQSAVDAGPAAVDTAAAAASTAAATTAAAGGKNGKGGKAAATSAAAAATTAAAGGKTGKGGKKAASSAVATDAVAATTAAAAAQNTAAAGKTTGKGAGGKAAGKAAGGKFGGGKRTRQRRSREFIA